MSSASVTVANMGEVPVMFPDCISIMSISINNNICAIVFIYLLEYYWIYYI